MGKIRLFIIIVLVFAKLAIGNDVVRIMTYNIENYGGKLIRENDEYKTIETDETDRNVNLRRIFDATEPDILIAQEICGYYDADEMLLNSVLNHDGNQYHLAFIDQKTDWNDDVTQDIGVYFKNQKFKYLSKRTVDIAGGYLRDALEVKLQYMETGDTISFYGIHLKASNGDEDIEQRKNSADYLRTYLNRLPRLTNFIVAGDFNMKTADEGAWEKLTGSQDDNDGRVFDPINKPGNWNHNENYASIHTQSSRYASGGLDDRFDIMFISEGIKEHNKIEYIPGSYTAYGNDGDHYNSSVNWQGNSIVSETIADALYDASDHLPVYADFDFTGIVKTEPTTVADEFELYQNYPNPFNPRTEISFSIHQPGKVGLNIFDMQGRKVCSLVNESKSAGIYNIKWDGRDDENQLMPAGVYFYTLSIDDQQPITRKMVFVK